MMYKLVSALAILAQANAADTTTDERIRSLQQSIALSERRILAEKARIATASDLLRTVHNNDLHIAKGRELGAGWQAYMNQGLATGGSYAVAGASGEGDFSDLSQETTEGFDSLNYEGLSQQQEPAQQGPDAWGQGAAPTSATYATTTPPNSALSTQYVSASPQYVNGAPLAAYSSGSEQPASHTGSVASQLSSKDLKTKVVQEIEDVLSKPLEEMTGISLGRILPADGQSGSGSPSGGGSAEPGGQATWKDYMFAGLDTGMAYVEETSGTAAGTNAPDDVYDLSQETTDLFSDLNHQGEDAPVATMAGASQDPWAVDDVDTATPDEWGDDSAGAWGVPEQRNAPEEKVAPWRDYMNAGLGAGMDYAAAGTVTANGETDTSGDWNTLSKQTTQDFKDLNAPAHAQQQQGASTESASSDLSHAPRMQSSEPTEHATWRDYMWQGIQTGLAFAQAGGATADGHADPQSLFGDLSKETTDDFSSLNHKGETSQASEPAVAAAAQPAVAAGSRRTLFVDPMDRF